jgi:hypothetical protein
MKIDKEKLKAFASLPDDELWRQVTMIAIKIDKVTQ